jgi:hypothetical protein
MRTLPVETNHQLRAMLDAPASRCLPVLLASTLAVAHDGTLQPRADGSLPKGVPLPIGIARGRSGGYLVGAYTDPLAVREPAAPTAGEETPLVAVTGDDLVLLAAANRVGVHVNPGSAIDLQLDAARVRVIAADLRARRAELRERTIDQRTLVTMRGVDLDLTPDEVALLRRELAGRGAAFAFVAEYALHDAATDPAGFTQLLVVGDREGRAGFALREDARRVLALLTGVRTDSVAYDAMPQVRHVARPLLQQAPVLPAPLIGVV